MNHRLIRLFVVVALGGFRLRRAGAATRSCPRGAARGRRRRSPSTVAPSPASTPATSRATTSGAPGRRSYVGYVECLKKFIKEQQALAEPHVKASNEAIDEHNTAVKEYNAQIEKAKAN